MHTPKPIVGFRSGARELADPRLAYLSTDDQDAKFYLAIARHLLTFVAEPSCAEVVMVSRKAIALTADPRLRQVILDTAAVEFQAEVTKLAQSMVAQGDPVYGHPVLASVQAA